MYVRTFGEEEVGAEEYRKEGLKIEGHEQFINFVF